MKISSKSLIILIILIALLCMGALAAQLLSAPRAQQVRITVDGAVWGSYPLAQERTVRISPESGAWHNTIVIRDGKAWVAESDCANQICVNTPALTANAIGVIACLPHGVVVELVE